MPELPEAEAIRLPVIRFFSDGVVESIKRGNNKKIWIGENEYRLEELFLFTVRRTGKVLIFDWRITKEKPAVLLISRLGMSGTWLIQHLRDPLPDHCHLVISFKDSAHRLVYRDPRRFGRLEWAFEEECSVILASQGPDILKIPADDWYREARRSSRTIRSLLLDQKISSGIGNIYASEILFAAGLSPFRTGKSLSKRESYRILDAARQILESAIRSGGSTIHSFQTSLGENGRYQDRHTVYGRAGKPCLQCSTPIQSVREASRTLFYCPVCQKRQLRRKEKTLREALTAVQ
ncbi:bifunctional DNA-formamidopyrimidine glycosylase/DNA-(apurinic or apyrimidinic site) lyase [Leptospirillum ferriphilum]|uniref:bifunctional DNA-formamidopyrimidine glycosylase/DNA-(apurinic or apyrimidinic site) lyase n=1 Tax=Leptospirillum ferriphilum TaxID=178606 RepID=UPI003EE5B9FB